MILYEYPLNERVRTCLRLEHLFQRLGTLAQRESPIDHHYAINTLFEIMDVTTRADLKTDTLKELEKQKQILNSYRGNPAISEALLDQITTRLDTALAALSQLSGKVGATLLDNEWLMSIRSRISIPGGTCEFDLPAYFAWQHFAPALRQRALQDWMATLAPLGQATSLLLELLRQAGSAQKVVALGGQYQQTLPQGRTFLLLRLRIDEQLGLVPEISANRLLVCVRLMRQEDNLRLQTCTDDASFELTLCS